IKKIIASTYRFRMKLSKLTGMGINILENKTSKKALVNFYSLEATTNSGDKIPFEKYSGKKVLIVNLASQCGYTPQYSELEQLKQENKEIIILGFPSNNFGAQEPGTDKEIADFCKVNYGVTFQLFKKDSVSGKDKQPVYQWLSDINKNGWNDREPQWNFYKYLVDENGSLSKIFSSSVSPADIFL
ncbi:MAG: glutathione peroxidase, partial [Ginsengibacter sp.]